MRRHVFAVIATALLPAALFAQKFEVIDGVEGQPLGENATRLVKALDQIGAPLPKDLAKAIGDAAAARDAAAIQKLLDPNALVQVSISPEARVKAARGPAAAILQQYGETAVILKIVNDSTVKSALKVSSPQAGPVYSGGGSDRITKGAKPDKNHFLDLDLYAKQPMTGSLSGLKVEYAIALITSSEAGKREATLGFDVGQGTQDLGFRGEVPILFEIKPAVVVRLGVTDFDGKPTVGRFTFKDGRGHVYPPQAKRLAPDFFFQEQVYRKDGDFVLLPPGELTMSYGRGPEYKMMQQKILVSGTGKDGAGAMHVPVKLERWINPVDYGWYSGDHHIHAAGCQHYTNPTEGVFANDMFLHVKGEGLNVGCNLTWGPCYNFQRQFFEPTINKVSEPFCVLKYDLEISGFGSQAMGHVCLLNLNEQTYPGSEGTSTKGWPMWTTPVMRWAKEQGGVTGYAHSANGLDLNPGQAARRTMAALDANKDGAISREEASKGLLPGPFDAIDADKDGLISMTELNQFCESTHKKGYIHREGNRFVIPDAAVARTVLPNYVVPEMNGIGAQEICVTTAMGVCDFISAMDTDRVPEWNCWYHIMNCGFPLKASGETDFPCISGSRVGQGRVYVRLGKVDRVDFGKWCEGIAKGRSYISDGYAHALDFRVNGEPTGGEVKLDAPGKVTVTAKVAFASEIPLGTSVGGPAPQGNKRTVELIVNGQVADSIVIPADNQTHDLQFNADIAKSSWVALRHFPQMHTNPVNVIVAGKPIRASKQDAQWCIGVIEQLWRVRGPGLPQVERAEARKTFDKALEMYKKIRDEAE
jgi:hypothetical protein